MKKFECTIQFLLPKFFIGRSNVIHQIDQRCTNIDFECFDDFDNIDTVFDDFDDLSNTDDFDVFDFDSNCKTQGSFSVLFCSPFAKCFHIKELEESNEITSLWHTQTYNIELEMR